MDTGEERCWIYQVVQFALMLASLELEDDQSWKPVLIRTFD